MAETELVTWCNRFDYFYDRPWQPHEPRQTRLVLIGRELEQVRIESI
ncbi:GTP-binding protein [Nostoc sp.]